MRSDAEVILLLKYIIHQKYIVFIVMCHTFSPNEFIQSLISYSLADRLKGCNKAMHEILLYLMMQLFCIYSFTLKDLYKIPDHPQSLLKRDFKKYTR